MIFAAVVKATVVLWVFFTFSWNYGGVRVSRGWFSASVHETMEECEKAAKEMREGRSHWIICLPATHEPEGPKGKVMKKGLEILWPADQREQSVTLLSQ